MDLLLQAAKMLELDQSRSGNLSPKTARGSMFQHYPRTRGDNSENSDGSISYSENGFVGGEDDSLFADKRRAGGAGTREVHNQLEKNRRKQLRECFSQLQQVVPSLENRRVATQSILQGAIKHIKSLKKKDVEQEREIQMLAKKKSELKKKYDTEYNKCTEEQHKAAEVILQIIRSKTQESIRSSPPNVVVTSASPIKAVHSPVASIQTDTGDDSGHTSDSTTTASEGPCDQDDISDDDTNRIASLKLSLAGKQSRKRTWDQTNKGGSGKQENSLLKKSNNTAAHNATRSPQLRVSVESLVPKKSGTNHSSSNSLGTTPSVSSSSFALKQMLEQRKKNQVSALLSSPAPKRSAKDNYIKQEYPSSNLTPVAPAPPPSSTGGTTFGSMCSTFPVKASSANNEEKEHVRKYGDQSSQIVQSRAGSVGVNSKGNTKSSSSLTSSYPMISNHLASSVRKPNTGILPPGGILDKMLEPVTSPMDIWTMSGVSNNKSMLLSDLKSSEVRSSAAPNVKASTSPGLVRVEMSDNKQPTISFSSSLTIPLLTSTGATRLFQSSSVSTTKGSSKVTSMEPIRHMPAEIVTPFNPSSLKTSETKKNRERNPFVLSSKVSQSAYPLGTGPHNATLLGKNIIGSNTSVTSVQPVSLTPPVLTAADWPNSKIVPAIIPISLASILRVQGGVGPLATFAASASSLPISLAPIKASGQLLHQSSANTAPSMPFSSTGLENTIVELDRTFSGQNIIMAPKRNAISTSKVDMSSFPASTSISQADNNARIAALLAGSKNTVISATPISVPQQNSMLNMNIGKNRNIGPASENSVALSSSVGIHSNPPAAATVTLSLPDGLKPFTPTMLPLTWATAAGLPIAGSTSGSTPASGLAPNTGPHQLQLLAPLTNQVLASSLATGGHAGINGLLPTVVHLGQSGQMALLTQSGLPGQPFVVMTSGGLSANGRVPAGIVSGTNNMNTVVSSSSSVS